MSGLFSVIEDGFVITYSNGVYRQAKLYRRGDGCDLYAGVGNGFVRLLQNSGTTAPSVSWQEIVPPPHHFTTRGKLGAPELVLDTQLKRI